jgi:hypothetical protein
MAATPDGPEHAAGRFVFDEFVVETISRTLFQDGTLVPLNSKAFDTLLLRRDREAAERGRRRDVPDESIARFPSDTHRGGDWTVTARGLYFLNASLPSGRAIEFLPFRFARPGGVTGTARPIRVAFPTAPASERARRTTVSA